MEIRVLGWKYSNIRQLDNLEVSLTESDSTPHKITMLMMRNGTGKTTTIDLIHAVLSGEAVSWSASQVRSFRPTAGEVDNGSFILRMKYDNKIYSYTLNLDYKTGVASYQTSKPAKVRGGKEDGRALPSEFKGVFDNPEFINRFIFNGEQAKKTLSTGNREAELAITYLYQINKFDELIATIQKLKVQRQTNSFGKSVQSVKQLRTRYNTKKRQYKLLTRQRDSLILKHEKLTAEEQSLKDSKNALINSNDKLRAENERLKDEQKENELALRQLQGQILTLIKKPYNVHEYFHTLLKDLAENMQALRLPKTIAKEFFNELADSKNCICGTPIGKTERDNILSKADEFLGQDQLGALNAIKSTLKGYALDDEAKLLRDELEEKYEKSKDIENQLNRIASQVKGEDSQRLKQIENRLTDIDRDKFQTQKTLNVLDGVDRSVRLDENNCIPEAKKAMDDQWNSYLIATDTYKYTKQADTMCKYLEKIRDNALSRLKKTIIVETNKKIHDIIKNDKIVIESIDGHIKLQNREGVSEGQTLAVAYSYIGSLFEHSMHSFPFIVDTPAAPMDLDVRREVAIILPNLFHQLVIFVTSAEKTGFAEKFYQRDDVYYLTVEGQSGVSESFAHEGKDYFDAFQSTEEDNNGVSVT